MFASLRALLEGVIDYAGLFPPAKLPLDQAIRNYARYRQGPEAWMLGRFICPAARLADLAPLVNDLYPISPPFVCSALGQGGKSTGDMLAGLNSDLQAIERFREGHGDRWVVDAYEVRLPEDFFRPNVQRGGSLHDAEFKTLDYVAAIIDNLGPPALTPYYEAALGPAGRDVGASIIAAIANDNILGLSRRRQRWRSAGFKLRCGGLETSSFPSPEQVAFIVTRCRDAGVPLKFTAGLHHPIRHFDAGLQTPMHGFLNVFVAGVLAHARRLSEEQVRPIIEDEDAGHFVFDDAGLRWKDLGATTDEVITARRELATSFGSCSFDEPRDDLRALGLLD